MKKIKRDFLKKIKLKNINKKYAIMVAAAVVIPGTYIIYDLATNQSIEQVRLTKEDLLKMSINTIQDMKYVEMTGTIDFFTKKTIASVTTPYLIGQQVEYAISKGTPYMIHGDGNTSIQMNGPKEVKRYEVYENIGTEDTVAYENKEDLIWVKKGYQNKDNIEKALDIFQLIQKYEEDIRMERAEKIDGKTCGVLEFDIQYEDALPYLLSMSCQNNADEVFKSINRNGFYGYLKLYVDVSTGEPVRLNIDFKDTANAFADVDGKNEGWKSTTSSFYFQLDFANFNQKDAIDIELDVIENAIDEMIFWERLKNGDLSYEELLFYQSIFGYNKEDFDYYMNKMGIDGEEYNKLLAIFNFDEEGNARIPLLTSAQFEELKELFKTDLGYEYYQKLLGITKEEYAYYLDLFKTIKSYGNFHLFETLSSKQLDYYNSLLITAGNNYGLYDAVMSYIKANYGMDFAQMSEADFKKYLYDYQNGKDYSYFKETYGFTKSQYESFKSIMEFIKNNYDMFLKYNSNFKSEYDIYAAMLHLLNSYEYDGTFFDYTQSEFLYYSTMLNHSGSSVSYIEYLLGKVDLDKISGNSYLFENLSPEQLNYYTNILTTAGNNYGLYDSVMSYIKANYGMDFAQMSEADFKKYLFDYQNGKDFSHFQNNYGFTKSQYESFKSIMAFIKSNYNTFITYNPDFHSEYHVYTAMIYLLNNYTNYGKDFDYTQSEFLYYTAMINHTGNNASYIDYLLGKIENNTISGNSFLNNYAMNNMTQAQYDYYYILTQLAGKDAIIRNDLMGFISGFASYNYQPLSKNTFDKYFSEFQSGKGQSYFCDKYGWNQKEYNYYKKMFSMIIKNQNNISNSGNYTSSYEYYKDLLDAMSGYQLYQKDFQYSKIEFDYYISLYQSVSGYMSYKDYVANSDYSTSTYEFYSSIYNTNIKLQEKFKTFEEFFAYVNSVGYEAMLIEFELDSYVAAYDDKVGEDAEDASGINKGELSNKWYSYSFSYKDDILGIPFAVNHLLEKSGFQCNQKDMPIAEGKEINITLIKGKSIINAVVKNNKNKEIPVKECDVISISISQNMSEEDLKDFEFPAGIKIGDKKDKIENVYGAPYDQNSSKGLTHFYYRSSKKNETMKMIFSNNVLTKITLSKT